MIQKLPLFLFLLAHAFVPSELAGLQARANAQRQDLGFSGAAEMMAEKIPIVLVENRLDLGLPDRDTAFGACREIVGGRGGGGSSSSGNMWSCNSSSGTIRAEMGNSFEIGAFLSADRLPGKSVFLNGLESPFPITSIRQSPEELLAFHLDTSNSRVFWLRATGTKVVLVNLDGAQALSLEGDSWEQLNTSHDLLSLCADLQDIGINLPKTAPWMRVATMIRELIAFPESGWQEFMKEFEGLNSTKFEERDAASARLATATTTWQVAIAWGLMSPTTPPEVKARLRAAVAADPELPANHLIQSVTSGKLHLSPTALIRVLVAEQDKSKDNLPVYSQLRAVTGQEIGDDLNAWKTWLAKSAAGTPGSETGNEAGIETVPAPVDEDVEDTVITSASFDSAKVGLSKLLAISIDANGRWVLDRDSWRIQFGGREAGDLIRELKEGFSNSGLPAGWLDIGKGYDPDYVGFPQILFEKYTESLVQGFSTSQEKQMAQIRFQQQMNRNASQPSQKSLNRQYEASGLKANLTMHAAQRVNRENLAEEFFDIEVSEVSAPGRMIHFREENDGSLKLFCMGPGQTTVLGLGQNPDGECWIHLIESGKVTTVQADNALSLLTENRDWFDRAVKPVFADLGIGLGVAAGGPLQIVNQGPIE